MCARRRRSPPAGSTGVELLLAFNRPGAALLVVVVPVTVVQVGVMRVRVGEGRVVMRV